MSLSILGTGSCLPALEVSNGDLSRVVDTSDEWIASRTGIRSRHILARGETLTGMAAEAGRRALENAGVSADELDLILCATIQGDYITPSLANLVQGELGARCPAFDLNAACSGFMYGLDVAQAYIDAGKARRVLLICAEHMSKVADWTDRSTCVLFGDGAAAAVLEEGQGLRYIRVESLGRQWECLYAPAPRQRIPFDAEAGTADAGQKPGLHMNGQTVFKFAVSACVEGIQEALASLRLTADDIGHFLIHQANGRIVDAVRRGLGQGEEKFPLNITHTANISGATIPCLLDELNRAGRLTKGETLVFAAAGAGLTTGIGVITWEK